MPAGVGPQGVPDDVGHGEHVAVEGLAGAFVSTFAGLGAVAALVHAVGMELEPDTRAAVFSVGVEAVAAVGLREELVPCLAESGEAHVSEDGWEVGLEVVQHGQRARRYGLRSGRGG